MGIKFFRNWDHFGVFPKIGFKYDLLTMCSQKLVFVADFNKLGEFFWHNVGNSLFSITLILREINFGNPNEKCFSDSFEGSEILTRIDYT